MIAVIVAITVVALAIWGPEVLAGYRDKGVMNKVSMHKTEVEAEAYRYSLTNQEKLYILSKCLSSHTLPESEENRLSRLEAEDTVNMDLTGTYAMVVNHKDSDGKTIPESEGIALCRKALEDLIRLGIVSESVRLPDDASYSAVLYSAIEVPEPRNNVLVWKISLNTDASNRDRTNRLLDAYVDADTGKVYEFYVRSDVSAWRDVVPDELVENWAEYMSLGESVEYEGTNPLSETTPYFKEYVFDGMDQNTTIVTVGFYEGINEIFLKISR